MKKAFLPILIVVATLCFSACDEVTQALGLNGDTDFLSEILGQHQDQMKVIDVNFSPDYKTFDWSKSSKY